MFCLERAHERGEGFEGMIYRLTGTQFSVSRGSSDESNVDTASMCSDDTMGE
jgi:hypothetical protein